MTPAQQKVIDALKNGAYISYFRGIGTRFSASACLEDKDGKQICTVSRATVRALRDKANLLEEYDREMYHSKYRLKLNRTI